MQKDLEKVSPGAKLMYYLNAGAMDNREKCQTWPGKDAQSAQILELTVNHKVA